MLSKNGFLSLVKGCIVGISGLVKGISYSAIILSLGLYEDVVESFSNLFRKNNKKLYFITIPVLLGMLLITLASFELVEMVMENYKNQAIFLTLGIMISGYKLFNEKKKETLTIKKALVMLAIVLFVVLFQIILLDIVSISLSNSIIFIPFLGLLTGVIILIPGIKQSFWIEMFNKGEFLHSSLTNILTLKSFLIILLFVIGLFLGLLVVSKLMYYLLKRYSAQMILIMKAFLLSAIVMAVLEIEKFTFSFVNIFTIILAFLWGYILVKNLEKE